MATVWSGGGDYQLGIETWCAAYTDTTETWSVRVWFWTSKTGTYNKTTTLHISGGFTYNERVNIGVGSEHKQLLYESHDTWNRLEGQPRTISVSASLSGFHHSIGGVSASFPVSARAIGSALKPKGVSASVSGEKVIVYYTCVSPKERPCTQIKIWYQDWGENNWYLLEDWQAGSWGRFPDEKQYTYDAVKPPLGQRRRWSVGLYNSTGGDWEATDWITAKLYAPSAVNLTRYGGEVTLVWHGLNNLPGSYFEIYNWDTYSRIATVDYSESDDEWYIKTLPAPTTSSVKYAIRQVDSTGSVKSDFETSNRIELLAPPNPPTELSPAPGYAPVTQDIRVSWQHNSTDGTAQKAYEIQYRYDSGQWHTLKGTAESAATLTTGSNETTLQWRVRTKGEHEQFSPWSQVCAYEAVSPPYLTVLQPETETIQISKDRYDCIFSSSRYPAQFTISYTVKKKKDGTTVKQEKVTHSANSDLHYRIQNIPNECVATVTVHLRAKTDAREDEKFTIETKYPQPPTPQLLATWVGHGKIFIRIDNNAAPGQISHNIVQRRDKTGWTTIANDIRPDDGCVDKTPPFTGNIIYRVIAVSNLNTQAISPQTAATGKPGATAALTCNGLTIMLQYNVEKKETYTMENVSRHFFLGRTLPVLYGGRESSRSLGISFMLAAGEKPLETVELLETLVGYAYPILYRDVEGTYMWGMVSEINFDRARGTGQYGVSLTLEETEGGL